MNRRRMFAILPMVPVGALLSVVTSQPVAADPIDTRLTYKLSDYLLLMPSRPFLCPTCDRDHVVYTRGCHPVAFPRAQVLSTTDSLYRSATPDSVPYTLECPGGEIDPDRFGGPHEHHDFRWVDA